MASGYIGVIMLVYHFRRSQEHERATQDQLPLRPTQTFWEAYKLDMDTTALLSCLSLASNSQRFIACKDGSSF